MKSRAIITSVIALLMIGLVVGAALANRRITDLQMQVLELTQKVQARDALLTLEEQTRCSKQAENFFTVDGHRVDEGEDFFDHYNVKMKKCITVIKSIKFDSKSGEQLIFRYSLGRF